MVWNRNDSSCWFMHNSDLMISTCKDHATIGFCKSDQFVYCHIISGRLLVKLLFQFLYSWQNYPSLQVHGIKYATVCQPDLMDPRPRPGSPSAYNICPLFHSHHSKCCAFSLQKMRVEDTREYKTLKKRVYMAFEGSLAPRMSRARLGIRWRLL